MKIRTLFLLPTILCMLLLSGCGNNNYGLSGKVTFSDDGSPVSAGTIFFSDGKFMSQGAITNGSYVVGTMSKADGIPPGTYKVYFGGVVSTEEIRRKQDDDTEYTEVRYTSLIDAKYTSADTSGLTFTADGKTKTFDVKLDRAPNAKE